ncbi:MAG: hypothetical protein HOK35_10445 [Cytophagia bacterium]|jgi:hypothetical protein|nr:hypothetical protein [Cytophagia bacterium]MBT7994581.1 hypothetical protein [Bacteroidota bacterium]
MKKQIINLNENKKIKPGSEEFDNNVYFSEISKFLSNASKEDKDLYYKYLKKNDFIKFQALIRNINM